MMKSSRNDTWTILFILFMGMALTGCAMTKATPENNDQPPEYAPGTIISAATGQPVSFEELLADIATVRVIYVGEQHTQPHHHAAQLKVINALAEQAPEMSVGMEMFDRTYQPVLDRWTSGALDREAFIRQSHWYANWRYDFSLYEEILNLTRDKGLRLIGLNIPFHIPPKIAVGGLDNLREAESVHLPENINTQDPDHRAYVRRIFDMHHARGRDNFEYFYSAQCVWEDVMAETVARRLTEAPMVVLAGNGHIIRKFGIPNRAFERTGATFRTLYLVDQGEAIDLSWGDYIWITPAAEKRHGRMHGQQPGK